MSPVFSAHTRGDPRSPSLTDRRPSQMGRVFEAPDSVLNQYMYIYLPVFLKESRAGVLSGEEETVALLDTEVNTGLLGTETDTGNTPHTHCHG